ncbi:MAG: YihY/virulence factor BrkB family protein [Ignavibacteriales bacterium]|nr:YihY/virulence factor BrkB family protein [Ignavibacteriales bacterium]
MKNLSYQIKKYIKFFTEDIWRIRLSELKGKKAFFIKHQRIIILSIRNFRDDNCVLKSSGLTFYSMLSVVPVVAILFGIFKGFGLQENLEKILMENFKEYEAVMVKIVSYSNMLLENTKGGIIAGVGIILLLWTVIKLLNNIEYSLNDIWKFKTSRSVVRQFSDFLAIIFLAPLFFVLSSGLTVFISVFIDDLAEKYKLLGMIVPIISFLLKFLPYIIIWMLFTLFYVVMPNGPVKFSSAFFAAIFAGTLYQIVQYIYVTFQIGIANYNAIYGSFAVFPLFLIWLQTSWLIFLFGAEISYAIQNISNFEFEADSKNINYHQKKLISLAIAQIIAKNFQMGKKAMSTSEISEKLGIPIILTDKIISEFVEVGLFSKIYLDKDKVFLYQPAKDLKYFTIKNVSDALDKRGSKIPLKKNDEFKIIDQLTENLDQLITKSPENKLLTDL